MKYQEMKKPNRNSKAVWVLALTLVVFAGGILAWRYLWLPEQEIPSEEITEVKGSVTFTQEITEPEEEVEEVEEPGKVTEMVAGGEKAPEPEAAEPVSEGISEEEAVSLVKDLPEVKEWLDLFTEPDGTSPKTGGKPVIEFAKKEGDDHLIHVYEDMPTHTATFNWYYVNSKTGKITAMF